jgi:hypothetical protein
MLHLSVTAVIITFVALIIKETAMGDLGDIFNMFPRDKETFKTKQGQTADTESPDISKVTDPKSRIINKVIQNKGLLVILALIVFLVLVNTAYFLISYIIDHGTKDITDNFKPIIEYYI